MIRQVAMALVLCCAATAVFARPASGQEPYRLIAPQSSGKLGCWAGRFIQYDEIVGYSAFGDFFLRSRRNGEYVVLHPGRALVKSYGIFGSPQDFERDVLRNSRFADSVLRPQQLVEVSKRIGALGLDEIYVAAPRRPQDATPSAYKKANVWAFMDATAQLTGVCG